MHKDKIGGTAQISPDRIFKPDKAISKKDGILYLVRSIRPFNLALPTLPIYILIFKLLQPVDKRSSDDPAYPRMKTTIEGEDWFPLFKEGDERVFRKVFDLYYRSIVFYAQKILQDEIYAEDVVIESFRKAWEYRERFDTLRHLENFLYFVTRNACISYLRSDKVVQTTEQEWSRISADESDVNAPIDLERVQTNLLALVFSKLEELPGGNILRMSYLEGKSTKEIARELNITENTVYITKSRSLKVLRSLLSKNDWLVCLLLLLMR